MGQGKFILLPRSQISQHELSAGASPTRLELMLQAEDLSYIACNCTSLEPSETYYAVEQREEIQSLNHAESIFIFVSHAAAVFALAYLGKEILGQGLCIAIGKNSAKHLRENDLSPVVSKIESSEGLMGLAEMSDIKDRQVYIFRGHGGLDLIEKACTARGAKVTLLNLYERHLNISATADMDGLEIAQISLLLATSVENLKNFKNLVLKSKNHDWREFELLKVVALSERIASEVVSLGFKDVIHGDDSGTESLLREIKKIA